MGCANALFSRVSSSGSVLPCGRHHWLAFWMVSIKHRICAGHPTQEPRQSADTNTANRKWSTIIDMLGHSGSLNPTRGLSVPSVSPVEYQAARSRAGQTDSDAPLCFNNRPSKDSARAVCFRISNGHYCGNLSRQSYGSVHYTSTLLFINPYLHTRRICHTVIRLPFLNFRPHLHRNST
jgi:hypothetical protein